MNLADYMRESDTDLFLLLGPEAPKPGWIYRDFNPMPKHMWLVLLDILGENNIQIVSANSRQLPPAERCRASMWISPEGQSLWRQYLQENLPK